MIQTTQKPMSAITMNNLQVHFTTTRIPFNLRLTVLMTLLVLLTLVTSTNTSSRMLHYRLNGILALWQFKHSIGLDLTQLRHQQLVAMMNQVTHCRLICPVLKTSNSPKSLFKRYLLRLSRTGAWTMMSYIASVTHVTN
jgi:hypothetical protein